jgi:Zn-dependent protease with chaperone function
MALLLLFYLILTALPLPWPAPPEGLGLRGSAAVTAALTALPVLAAWWLGRRARRGLAADPGRREDVLVRYGRGKLIHLYGLMACHLLALTLGWGWTAPRLCAVWTADGWWVPPGVELVLMAPFLLGLGLSWACYYPAERAIHETAAPWAAPPFGGRWGYVTFLARQYLALTSVPLGLFLVQQGLARTWPWLFESDWFRAGMIGMVLAALVLAPWALRLILGLRPLPAGPVRDRLEAAGQRLGVRYAELLHWDTRGGVANAMVAGLVPRVRYVMLSDRLLAELTPEEVEAVFGHEAGHVKHGHMAFYLLFLVMSMAGLAGLWEVAGDAWGGPAAVAGAVDAPPDGEAGAATSDWRDWQQVPLMLSLGAYVFLAFGFVSRRCERQADLYGCRAVSCGRPDCAGHDPDVPLAPAGRGLCPTGIRTFISALEKVAGSTGSAAAARAGCKPGCTARSPAGSSSCKGCCWTARSRRGSSGGWDCSSGRWWRC